MARLKKPKLTKKSSLHSKPKSAATKALSSGLEQRRKTETVSQFGSRLKRLLETDEAYTILGPEGTWQAGGCWLLAEAVRKVLGPQAKLFAVLSERGLLSKHVVEHVVVEFDGKYIDADGAFTKEQLLEKMRKQEFVYNPRVVPFSNRLKKQAKENELICPAVSVRKLVEFLQ